MNCFPFLTRDKMVKISIKRINAKNPSTQRKAYIYEVFLWARLVLHSYVWVCAFPVAFAVWLTAPLMTLHLKFEGNLRG